MSLEEAIQILKEIGEAMERTCKKEGISTFIAVSIAKEMKAIEVVLKEVEK